MLRDWGSWDGAFNALTASICNDVLAIANARSEHVCVPLQGSGTFAVEASLGTLIPRTGKVLVPDNGTYCKRIVRILAQQGRASVTLPFDESQPANPARIDAALAADPSITHVAQVHCETGTGILNPIAEIAKVVARRDRRLIIDAMSSFGAIEIDAALTPFDALITASGKCLEGVPGIGIIIARRSVLEQSAANSASLVLDLFDQWQYLQRTGQWRFTPPTHVVAALRSAMDQFLVQGGLAARSARYRRNCSTLVREARALGLEPFLPDDLQAPIIVTFHAPADPGYEFSEFYKRVRDLGFILYPGKLTEVETFRVGCIGAIDAETMRRAVAAMSRALTDMGVRRLSRA